jgi:hypothetical protein
VVVGLSAVPEWAATIVVYEAAAGEQVETVVRGSEMNRGVWLQLRSAWRVGAQWEGVLLGTAQWAGAQKV